MRAGRGIKPALTDILEVSDAVDSMSRSPEQRGSIRKEALLRCWVIDTNVERFVSLADLSTLGARVLTATPPGVGERVELRLELPRGLETFIAKGRVVWRAEGFRGRGGVMGLAFDSVSAAGELESFIGDATGTLTR